MRVLPASVLPGPGAAVLASLCAALGTAGWLLGGAPALTGRIAGLGAQFAFDGLSAFFLLLVLLDLTARASGAGIAWGAEAARFLGSLLALAAGDATVLLAGLALAGAAGGRSAVVPAVALLGALAILGGGGFAEMRAVDLDASAVAWLLALVLLAAGLWRGPLAAYLLLRLLFDLPGGLPAWAGAGAMLAGALLAALAAWRALRASEVGRFVAWMGRVQVGMAMLGAGTALAGRSGDLAGPVGLGLAAVWLAAGLEAVALPVWRLIATRATAETGRRGFAGFAGMLRVQRLAGIAGLAAALALAAIPPGAGFVLLRTTLQGLPGLPVSPLVGALAALGAALAAGLSATAWLRVLRIGFAGAAWAGDALPGREQAGLALFGLASLALGVAPAALVTLAGPATAIAVGDPVPWLLAGTPPWAVASLLAGLAALTAVLLTRAAPPGFRPIPARTPPLHPAAGLTAPPALRRSLRWSHRLRARLEWRDPLALTSFLAAVLLVLVVLLTAGAVGWTS